MKPRRDWRAIGKEFARESSLAELIDALHRQFGASGPQRAMAVEAYREERRRLMDEG